MDHMVTVVPVGDSCASSCCIAGNEPEEKSSERD